jgi:hypothetical protein
MYKIMCSVMLKAHKIKKAIEPVCANFKAAGMTGKRPVQVEKVLLTME